MKNGRLLLIAAGITTLAAIISQPLIEKERKRYEQEIKAEADNDLMYYLKTELENSGGNYSVIKNWFDKYSGAGDLPNLDTNLPAQIYLDDSVKTFETWQSGSNVIVRTNADTLNTLEKRLIESHAQRPVDTGASFP